MSRYDHTQYGWMGPVVFLLGLVFVGLRWVVDLDTPLGLITLITGLLLKLIGVAFAFLRVYETEDALTVAFGVFGVPRRRVAYDHITSAAAERTTFIDGWGIHAFPGRGWIWNVAGYDCVALETKLGRLRVGTDDPEGLLQHLRERVPGLAQQR